MRLLELTLPLLSSSVTALRMGLMFLVSTSSPELHMDENEPTGKELAEEIKEDLRWILDRLGIEYPGDLAA